MGIEEIEKNFELKSVMDFIKEVKRESRMDIKEKLRLLNANSFYGSRITPKERDNMVKEIEDILRRKNMTEEKFVRVAHLNGKEA